MRKSTLRDCTWSIKSARRGDNHVGIASQIGQLRAHRRAANQDDAFKAKRLADFRESFLDLQRQFARRQNHQCATARTLARSDKTLQNRQRERQRFAGSGLRDADDIVAGETDGNRAVLESAWA